MPQASWTTKKAKKNSVIPHLNFLKNLDRLATGGRLDTETIRAILKIKTTGSQLTRKRAKTNQYPLK